jgi:hypothetical protein
MAARHLLEDPRPFKLRCEGELLERIREAAKESLRSVNAEINGRLRDSFDHKDQVSIS